MSSKKKSKKRSSSKKPKFISINNPPPQLQPKLEDDDDEQVVIMDQDNDCSQVLSLLEQDTVPNGSATITDLFIGSSASSSPAAVADHDHQMVMSPAASSPSVNAEWDGDVLARKALRGRERWVFCRSMSEEVQQQKWKGSLRLKLDRYEEILNAWSDKGSLYIDGEAPQIVPEIQQCGMFHQYHDNIAASVFVEVGNGGGWRVPEMDVEAKEPIQEGDKTIDREERVMRYKAKRRNRLFSKRIRYEVRKLNAEKRPRIKGRFVKRVDDM